MCRETLRKWRQITGVTKIVDQKFANLQIHVVRYLWKYQLVRYKEQTYCLTWLGLGLNVASKIMLAILKAVLKKKDDMTERTDFYIDDNLVDETAVPTSNHVSHFNKFGFTVKPSESLGGGAVLILWLDKDRTGNIVFTRENEISDKEIFSLIFTLYG